MENEIGGGYNLQYEVEVANIVNENTSYLTMIEEAQKLVRKAERETAKKVITWAQEMPLEELLQKVAREYTS